jgi:hypothetical protein
VVLLKEESDMLASIQGGIDWRNPSPFMGEEG